MAIGAAALAIGAAISKPALEKAAGLIVEDIAAESKKLFKKLKNAKELGKLHTHSSSIRKVKTLGQIDKAVDLMTFYCDAHVYIDKKRVKIESLDDFTSSENLLIEGIAGQGKSIFLRYLCSIEANTGNRVPIFGELRKVQGNEKIEEFISKTLKQYGIDAEGDVLDDLLDTGRIVLFLDAFDEVREDSRLRLASEIEALTLKHNTLRIVITSRPDSGIAACRTIRVVKLSDLEGQEYEKVIRKISASEEVANLLIKQIKQHQGQIVDLLKTPLLVTLLVIRFKSYPVIPEQLSGFYDDLFELLLQRHDGTKLGYKRDRACSMNDVECRGVFEAFCYVSKSLRGRLDYTTVYSASQKALNLKHIKESPQNFLTDIVKITCLLVKDGQEYRYIHKSVQEYYTATYIKSRPDVVLRQIYAQILDSKRFADYSQEVSFLEEIDTYRFLKHGLLPYLCRLFSASESDLLGKPKQAHIDVMKQMILALGIHINNIDGKFHIQGIRIPQIGLFSELAFQVVQKEVYTPFFDYSKEMNQGNPAPVPRERWEEWTIDKAVSFLPHQIKVRRGIDHSAKELTESLFENGRDAIAAIENEERSDDLSDLEVES